MDRNVSEFVPKSFTFTYFHVEQKICLKLVILFVSVMILDVKVGLFSLFFNYLIIINDSSPRQFLNFLNVLLRQYGSSFSAQKSEARCRTHHMAKPITCAIFLKTPLTEIQLVPNFVPKIVKKFFIHFLCSSEA